MIQTFWAATRGQAVVLFALMLLPILVAAGMAIDMSRQVTAKRHLQEAADAAVLAAAHAFKLGEDEMEAFSVANYTYFENLASMHGDVQCNFSVNLIAADFAAEASGSCNVPTIFGSAISGLSETRVEVDARAQAIFDDIEIALTADMSGSMSNGMLDADGNSLGSRLDVLRTAAGKLFDRLLIAGPDVKISIIPYNGGVNAGRWGNLAMGESELEGLDPSGNGKACPSERTGVEAFSDAAPDAADTTTLLNAENFITEHCKAENRIVPLTSDRTILDAAIADLETGGYTGGHRAAAWGWYTLSPEWATVWPAASTPAAYDDHVIKVLVLMTDGNFNTANYVSDLGVASTQALALCEAMKDSGVIVFSIGIDADAAASDMLRDCATTNSWFYDVQNGDELIAAYVDIANQFGGVKITE